MSGATRPFAPAVGDAPSGHGFLFDLHQCTGCNACELACSIENELPWGQSWRQVVAFNEARLPFAPVYHLSLACNHCAKAPCIQACPAWAIQRREATGAVRIDAQACIGCRYCSWACPYDAPRFDAQAAIMTKCTGCDHRLSEGRVPACVEQCPTSALGFGPLEGERSVPGFPVTAAEPAIRFQPLRESRRRPPESTWTPPAEVLESFQTARPLRARAISVRSEWPLLVFTLLMSVLVGCTVGSLGGGRILDVRVFLSLAALGAGTSVLHLGRKGRAWRAVLNVRRSWLSREVAGFGAFVGAATLYGLSAAGAGGAAGGGTGSAGTGAASGAVTAALGGLAAVLGLLTLFSIDRVYDVVRPREAPTLHSADTLLTALLAASIWRSWVPLALAVLAVKLGLYLSHQIRRARTAGLGGGGRMVGSAWLSGTRVAVGILAPALLWIAGPHAWFGWAILAVGIGESIDRAQFYDELAPASPRRQAETDLRRLRQGAAG